MRRSAFYNFIILYIIEIRDNRIKINKVKILKKVKEY